MLRLLKRDIYGCDKLFRVPSVGQSTPQQANFNAFALPEN
jgi:hypothetical protein